MSRKTLIALVFIALFFLLTPTGRVASQSIRQVFVTNFPRIQTIEGEVTVRGPVHLSQQQIFEKVVVPPVQPDDTTRLVEAGTLVTEGFPSVVLSLHGVVRGAVQKPGDVGAILIPDQETIREGFDETGMMPFAMETVARGITARTPYFASTQPRYTVGFSRYRVLLYNTTDKTVTVNLFAYLTN